MFLQANAIRELVAAVGLIAWGVLLVFAGRGNSIWLLNFRWEGKQPEVRAAAAKVTLVLGVAAIVIGGFMALSAVV